MEDADDQHERLVDSLADAEREIKQLQQAVESRTVIGQAEGILMERLGLDSCLAFEYLRRVSSHTNRKVIDIATEIAETRELPKY
ncbi:ANTAR domain-containing protein [Nocardioides okcheonensis]|uniref:ANTAR domain-containing protein n=1 Tax=Nocardioides okcheonensis TaxID=2894081 RepID=UPI001E4482FD|nr:ANTAR domain-containing protein [Nocardioides okcheonensis]UFN46664.1 ANTAR domain-containing protein [Nocardioides okcheonensis]